MLLHTHVQAYTRVFGHVCTHMKNTNKSISGADVLTVPSSLPPLLAPHSGASVITLKYLRPCVTQWRHQCHPEIFPRQSHRASNCNYFRTSPFQQPSALASLWISNHANQAGMFTPCCLSKGPVSSCVQDAQENPPLCCLSSLRAGMDLSCQSHFSAVPTAWAQLLPAFYWTCKFLGPDILIYRFPKRF